MINILSKETIDKIAAGEVVERPLSVVKELLENSIDSGADSVSVEIKGGGTELIRVTDNGSGIEKDDIPLAFMRHATSKLKTSEDLSHILSFGFRGEALASIAGVSQTELITKRAEDLYGYNYRIEGGEEKLFSEIGAPEGTTLIVRNLFYNVPARKKFLKSASTESAHICDIVEKTALSHPEIAIRLVADGRSLLHTSGNGRLKDVIFTIFGKEVSENLIEIDHEEEKLSISGYIGKPVISRSKRDFEVIFVNGRYIHSSLISKACEEAYKPFMMQHKFPFVMLDIRVSPEDVDVNVHPQKMEVRFSDSADIYNSVCSVIREELKKAELIVDASPEADEHKKGNERKAESEKKGLKDEFKLEPFEVKKAFEYRAPSEVIAADKVLPSVMEESAVRFKGIDPYREQVMYEQQSLFKDKGSNGLYEGNLYKGKTAEYKPDEDSPDEDNKNKTYSDEQGEENRFISKDAFAEYKIIGQVFDTYWIVEYKDKMYIIDQHAAHEKVLYERTMKEFRERTPQSQMIMPPIILSLSQKETQLVEKNISIFERLGFELEKEAGNDFIVRAVPANLYSIAEKDLLMGLVDGLSEDSGSFSPDIITDRIAKLSCKAAVKGHDRLSEDEARELLKELLNLENPYACPHGRPTIISMSKYELEKKFKRIV